MYAFDRFQPSSEVSTIDHLAQQVLPSTPMPSLVQLDPTSMSVMTVAIKRLCECWLNCCHLPQIKKQFKLSEKNITLHLRGFALTPDGPLTFLRDGDILVVAADKKLEVCSARKESDLRELLWTIVLA